MKRRSKRQRFGRFLGVSLMAFALALSAVPAEGVIAEEGVQTVSEAGDFTIENGVLTKYHGSGGDVTIPEGVTKIGNMAFERCSSLTSVTIPDTVTVIGAWAFNGCSGLTSIMIPNSVTEIGSDAFFACSSLTSVTIPDSMTEIGDSVFFGCDGLTNVTIPASVTKIGGSAFLGCDSLTSVIIPDSVTEIGQWAFEECSGLTSIMIPNSVTKIGDFAFCSCSGLSSITIPDSVTEICTSAFASCSSLTSVTIPASVTKIGGDAFMGCTSMMNITVDSNNQIYDSRENCNAVIETGTNKLVVGCKDTIIPYGISEIGNSAFSGYGNLISITIPESVTKIGATAFYGCSSLTNITIPNSVLSVGVCAFEFCSSLKEIEFPESVIEIGESAIGRCENLTDITILNKDVMLDGILGSGKYYWPNNSKTLTFYGYSNSTTQQFAKLLDEHKVEAELDTVTFIALDGGSSGDETKNNVAAVIQEGSNPPAYNGYDSALVSATVNGVKGTPILKVEAGSSIISGYISSNNLVDSQHDFDCVGYSLSLVDEAGNALTEFTDCIVTLPLPTGWADKNGTFWIGSIKPDGQFERIAANVVDVQGQKCIQFTTNHFSEYGIVVETLKSGNQGDNTGNDDNGNGSGDSGNGDNGSGSGDAGNGDNGSGSGDAGNGDNGSSSGDAGNGDNGSSPGYGEQR